MTRPSRGQQPDPARRPAPGVADLRGRLRSGYGSPEGVVPARAGTLHQDTDPAGTGSVWKKTTPSGNTGWVELGAGGMADVFSALDAAPVTGLLGTVANGYNHIKFTTEQLDVSGYYDPTTGLYQPPPGYYFVSTSIGILPDAADLVTVGFQLVDPATWSPTGAQPWAHSGARSEARVRYHDSLFNHYSVPHQTVIAVPAGKGIRVVVYLVTSLSPIDVGAAYAGGANFQIGTCSYQGWRVA